ncbi:RHS repeat-associated core domain-containing protein [Acetobacter sp.]|jgi:RHS repeat-associated protein|nr:RHS repeat-associated core domain-containing protein [Acetobacter sp.]MCH4091694.1 RHS domain-containing protein [Acetobacter sp.]
MESQRRPQYQEVFRTLQLASVEERSRLGVKMTRFAYDALGRRTEKVFTAHGPVAANDAVSAPVQMVHTRFLWSGNVLLAEGLDDQPLATVYLHEPGTFRPLALIRAGAVCHYHLDHLGTPREVTNDDGRIVWQARLKAWGGTARVTCDGVSQPIRFQGQYADAETGLYYNRFRYYAPDEGRYLQQDPIGLAGGVNVSAYVAAPTTWVDPFGLAGSCGGGSKKPNISRITPGSLPAEEEQSVQKTLNHIDNGTVPNDPTKVKWGTKFKNYQGELPGGQGDQSPYQEYRVLPDPSTNGAGPRRVVVNTQTNEFYYTWTHYGDAGDPSFVQIR